MTNAQAISQPRQRRPWLRRLGAAGFAFFLIKGLLWIFIPILAAKGFVSATSGQSARPAETRILTD